jgi:hypothetical protein
MPWTPDNGPARHTKKAKSAVSKRQWSDVANGVLAKTGDEGRAVREANAVIAQGKEQAEYHGSASNYKHSRPKRKMVKRSW